MSDAKLVNLVKTCCFPSNVGGFEKRRLWFVATWMSGKQHQSKCSN